MILLNTISNTISNYIISLLQLNSFLLKFLKHHTRSGSKLKPCHQNNHKSYKTKMLLSLWKRCNGRDEARHIPIPPHM